MKASKTERSEATKTAKCGTRSSFNDVFGDLYGKYRSEQSYFGYNPSVLKSGIQKYARRAEVNDGLWCLVEMDLFSLLEWDGEALNAYLRKYPKKTRKNTQASAKRIRTNMVNRLVVMMSEEVSISAWWMPSKMWALYEKWMENRGNASSRKHLVDMYYYLTSQKMIRLISDLHSVFLLPPDYVKPKHMDDLQKIHCNIQTRYPQIYSDQSRVGKLKSDIGVSKYPVKLQSCIKGIIYNLEIGSDNVFYWIKNLYDLELEDGVDRNKYMRIVWDLLYRFIDRNKKYEFVRCTIKALQRFFMEMKHKEKPIYLYHAVLLIARRAEIDWTSQPPPIDTPMADVVKLYQDHLYGGKMKIDDYVLDLHTKRMKWSAQCLENFAKIGAYIRFENETFLHPEYREIYLLLKKELDLFHSRGRQTTMIPNNLEIFCQKTGVRIEKLSKQTMAKLNDAPQAQLRTATFKKAVYIVEDLVFKGPYKTDDLRLRNNLIYTYAIQLLEAALQLPEWQRGSLRWEYIGCWDDDQYYLVAANVGKRNNIPYALKNSKLETSVKVVPRKKHLYRVSEIEGTEQLTAEIRSAALQHLYLRFLLDIGDSGTHNILKREDHDGAGRLIAGIDLEERRRIRDKNQPLDHLFRKAASKKQNSLYESDVCKIKSLSYSRLDQCTLERLGAVGIDLGRLKANAELWERLG